MHGTADNHCIVEYLADALAQPTGLFKYTTPLHLAQHVQQFRRINLSYWTGFKVGENVSIEPAQELVCVEWCQSVPSISRCIPALAP